jgi:hypothetical protein
LNTAGIFSDGGKPVSRFIGDTGRTFLDDAESIRGNLALGFEVRSADPAFPLLLEAREWRTYGGGGGRLGQRLLLRCWNPYRHTIVGDLQEVAGTAHAQPAVLVRSIHIGPLQFVLHRLPRGEFRDKRQDTRLDLKWHRLTVRAEQHPVPRRELGRIKAILDPFGSPVPIAVVGQLDNAISRHCRPLRTIGQRQRAR